MRPPPPELEPLLAPFGAEIARLFLAARRVVLDTAPEANELIYDAYNALSAAYTFSERLTEAFCHVAAYSRHVNLGFNRGAELPDPAGILVGSGARIRHVRIEHASALESPTLMALVEAAAGDGRERVEALPSSPLSVVRPTRGGKRRPTGSS